MKTFYVTFCELILRIFLVLVLASYCFGLFWIFHLTSTTMHEIEVRLEDSKITTLRMRGNLDALKVRTVAIWCSSEQRQSLPQKPACAALTQGTEATLKFRAEHDDYNVTLGLEKKTIGQ